MEVVIMRERGEKLQKLGDVILSLRGVKHGKMVLATTAKDVA
jgi:metal-responsive CopG/Arc/MetJ family transcriptional regulator